MDQDIPQKHTPYCLEVHFRGAIRVIVPRRFCEVKSSPVIRNRIAANNSSYSLSYFQDRIPSFKYSPLLPHPGCTSFHQANPDPLLYFPKPDPLVLIIWFTPNRVFTRSDFFRVKLSSNPGLAQLLLCI